MVVNLTYVHYEANIHWQRTEFWNTVWIFLRNIIIFQHVSAQLKIVSWLTRYEIGRVSAVGIATRYGMDGPEIESRWGRVFFAPVETGLEARTASCKMDTMLLSRG